MCRIGNVSLSTESNDYSCRHTWMRSEWLESSRIWLPCGRICMNNVDVNEPTSCVDRVDLGCIQREWIRNEIFVKEYRENVRITIFLLEQLQNLPGWEKTSRKNCRVVIWYGRTCKKRAFEWYCEVAKKRDYRTVVQSLKSLCVDDHHFNKDKLETVGELLKVCSQNCLEMPVPGTHW